LLTDIKIFSTRNFAEIEIKNGNDPKKGMSNENENEKISQILDSDWKNKNVTMKIFLANDETF
jgi:hypothetical protein